MPYSPTLMTTSTDVFLEFRDGTRENIGNAHVHGFRDGHLLVATGPAENGLDARVIRKVDVSRLALAETREVADPSEPDDGPNWTMSWPDSPK